MTLISESAAKRALEEHHEDLALCVQEAWETWDKKVRSLLPMPSRRMRAAFMHDGMISNARERFGNTPGVRLIETPHRFLVAFGTEILVHFKLVDVGLQTRNFPTPTAVRFDRQLSLALYPPASRLTVGYRLKPDETALSRIVLMLKCGKRIEWVYQLPMITAAVVKPIKATTANPLKVIELRPVKKNPKGKKTSGEGEDE